MSIANVLLYKKVPFPHPWEQSQECINPDKAGVKFSILQQVTPNQTGCKANNQPAKNKNEHVSQGQISNTADNSPIVIISDSLLKILIQRRYRRERL